MLLFHPGGYVFGDPSFVAEAAEHARALGMRPDPVTYTLFDPAQALRDAKAAAREAGRRSDTVYAYGESAGGGLAARLAQAGLADRAAVISPIADLDRYANAIEPDPETQALAWGTERDQRRLSPVRYESPVPILALTGAEETGTQMGRAVRRWARRDPLVRRRIVRGGHIAAPHYKPAMRRALRFLR